jgi:Mlc titration factor MtfA (ptsG expression regulator)
VIATVPGADGRRRLPGPDQAADPAHGICGTTSANVVVHEATHAVDAVSGRPSDAKEFDAAFDSDRDRSGSKMGRYWNQPTNEEAGRHEAYAESLAMYRDEPEALKRDFPAIYAYWEKRLGPPPQANS